MLFPINVLPSGRMEVAGRFAGGSDEDKSLHRSTDSARFPTSGDVPGILSPSSKNETFISLRSAS